MKQREIMDAIVLSLFSYGIHSGVALKGGYALNKLLGTRSTVDIDMSICNLEFWHNMQRALKLCGNGLVSTGVVAGYKITTPVAGKSGGIRFLDDTGTVIIKVDMSIQRLDFGVIMENILLDTGAIITEITIPVFRFERMLGDKISATFSSRQFRRVKDIYDIYCIVVSCKLGFDELTLALTDREFKPSADTSPFRSEAIIQWNHAWNKFKLRRMEDGTEILKPDLSHMLGVYSRFMGQYLDIFYRGGKAKYWDNRNLRWVQ